VRVPRSAPRRPLLSELRVRRRMVAPAAPSMPVAIGRRRPLVDEVFRPGIVA
jgi:hypothetical protein